MASSLVLGSGVGAAASAGRKQPVHARCALPGGLAGSSCHKVRVQPLHAIGWVVADHQMVLPSQKPEHKAIWCSDAFTVDLLCDMCSASRIDQVLLTLEHVV